MDTHESGGGSGKVAANEGDVLVVVDVAGVGDHAGGDAKARVNGFAEGGAMDGSVDRRHEREVKLVAALLGEGQADQAAAVLGHEVDGVGRDFFGGHCEVALVFAVLVVNQYDHAALANLFDGFFDGGESGARVSHSGISLVRIDDSTGDLGDGSDRC